MNPEIAEQLVLSVRTVETHRANVQRKTGLTTRAELVAYALDHDLVKR
jgi:two-component system response regulator NreC